MIIKCEKCGKQWVHKQEYAYVSRYCSYKCSKTRQPEDRYYRDAIIAPEKTPQISEEEYKKRCLIEHPDFLEID